MFELIHYVFSEFHDISDIDVATEESVADFLEALFDGVFVDDCSFIEFL
jgi:hypothetical protein